MVKHKMVKNKIQIIGSLLIILTIIGAVLCSFLLIQTENRNQNHNQTNKKPSAINTQKRGVPKKAPSEMPKKITSPVNILVMGIDQRGNEKARSDTISIYHLDPVDHKNSVLAVPRDTYLQIAGRKMDKVNHAYAFR